VEAEDEWDGSQGAFYRIMEGKGMLMVDREQGQPSHTMWVIKPVSLPQFESARPSVLLEQGEVGDEPATTMKPLGVRSGLEPVTPFPITRPINTSLILCRICECHIPQWYFEKHNETCSEVHRLEAEIGECNESVAELRNTIRELMSALDRSSPLPTPEYRGMPIFSPSTSPATMSPLQMFRAPLKMQKMGVKKVQRQLLEKLDDILQIAQEISVPALKEDESKEPIERQRLLSPSSERKMSQVKNWCKPLIEDAALTQLAEDAERVMRQKADNVIRMQNVIKYSEKIRQEWEGKVEEVLSLNDTDGEGDEEDDSSEDATTGKDEVDYSREVQGNNGIDDSSATSEYEFGRDGMSSGGPSSEPTPLGSSSPVPSITKSDYRHGWPVHTRPSTPSSISSPLALAIPIIASRSEDIPPPMDLNDPPPGSSRSPNNLDVKLNVIPTLSPIICPSDAPITAKRVHNRRLSTIAPIMSPTVSSSGQPLSPRLPSVAPSSRTTPTSIKDFEIIKPISKGAFGSVFLARKKATGDYFAIKVLKKADMIAKNQITNVKAERMILMQQAESPFVAKLYWTFQSKENLYLVMEYLNGGDCAALIKSLGSLPEEWTRNYIAEVVLGLDYLHQRGVVHRYATLFFLVFVILMCYLFHVEISNQIIFLLINTVT
jgi:serine/threonine-protein kinase RIM15